MRHNQVPISVQPSFTAAANGSIQKHRNRSPSVSICRKRGLGKESTMAAVVCVCALRKRHRVFHEEKWTTLFGTKNWGIIVQFAVIFERNNGKVLVLLRWFVFFAGLVFLLLETSSTKHPHSVSTFLQNRFFGIFWFRTKQRSEAVLPWRAPFGDTTPMI